MAKCAEFYGREFALFDGVQQQGASLSGLSQLLAGAPPARARAVIQHMTKTLAPVMEKALLHPPMVHRLLRDYLQDINCSRAGSSMYLSMYRSGCHLLQSRMLIL
ncbi:PUM-HD domain-containing protein [Haematococcus lacustris]|uniref:PUM-HD domain-containing protein n=1 Tax=Haematococcus lacustris TaxID=44745 RepID=A0A699YBK2_HAELA|nr:PUM-HD domain-containing protein [Haematococcus lacustris]